MGERGGERRKGPRLHPLIAATVLAALPATGFGMLWRYAEARRPEPKIANVTADTTPAPAAGSIAAPVLSVRRTPSALAADVRASAMTGALGQVSGVIGSGSCMAVAVNGQLISSSNINIPIRPASNMKLVTASVALDVLGVGYQFTTVVRGTLESGGKVNGDLYLVGGGDPVLADSSWNGPNEAHQPFNETPLETLADSIVAAGVTSVSGQIIGDATRYDDVQFVSTWAAEDHIVEGGPIGALLVDDGHTSASQVAASPAQGAAQVLTQLLKDRGVSINRSAKEGTAAVDAPPIAQVQSQPLPAIVAEMLTTSDNNTAEMLLKEIGVSGGGGGSTAAGIAIELAKLTEWGIPLDGVQIIDGSGLSADNRLTCAAILALLDRSSIDDAIGRGLPVAAAPGGTLDDAFVGTTMAGILRAKTGTLSAVKALSGYMPIDAGGEIEFSLIINGNGVSDPNSYGPIWALFVSAFDAFRAGPTVEALSPAAAPPTVDPTSSVATTLSPPSAQTTVTPTTVAPTTVAPTTLAPTTVAP